MRFKKGPDTTPKRKCREPYCRLRAVRYMWRPHPADRLGFRGYAYCQRHYEARITLEALG